jgi:hypothetical protein
MSEESVTTAEIISAYTGVYARVARKLKVSPSLVSKVASGESNLAGDRRGVARGIKGIEEKVSEPLRLHPPHGRFALLSFLLRGDLIFRYSAFSFVHGHTVARKLKVSQSMVSKVADRERISPEFDAALRPELIELKKKLATYE